MKRVGTSVEGRVSRGRGWREIWLRRATPSFVWLIGSVALCLLLVTACRHKKAPSNAKGAEAPVSVKVLQPKRGDITRSVTLPAVIVANQQATLYAKVTGYLKRITVDKGDAVKEGDLLAEIEVPELLADAARFKAEAEIAALDYQRTAEAQQKAPDLVPRQNVDEAKAKAEVAKANLARAETLLGFTKIVAPFTGTITRRLADPGAFVPAATSGSAAQNAALVTLADFRVVRVQVSVPEPEVPLIQNGLPVKVTLDELPGQTFEGRVTRAAQALDEATRTMLTEIDLENPKNLLRPGMYALVKIGIEQHTDALLLPTDAVLFEKAGTSVFLLAEGKAKRVPVKTGFNDGTSVEILKGIGPADSVIAVGKMALNNGQAVKTTEGK
jgi:membrane fusion protein, multidrug efflux system